MRLLSLIVFLAVGLLVAWFSRNSGMASGTTFLVAFIPAFLAAWFFEWVVGQFRKRPHA